MKFIIKKIIYSARPILLIFLALFYDRKYLTGRYFDKSIVGFMWAFRSIWINNILRLNSPKPWPTGLTCQVSVANNIFFHPDDLNNFQSPGTYFQNFNGNIYIGRGSFIGPNVGIITANHKLDNLNLHDEGQDVIIGEECWIGMNSVILPGVELGPGTVVAAGSIVNKSFAEGSQLIGGVPARVIKKII